MGICICYILMDFGVSGFWSFFVELRFWMMGEREFLFFFGFRFFGFGILDLWVLEEFLDVK